jgi:hypothetical protein
MRILPQARLERIFLRTCRINRAHLQPACTLSGMVTDEFRANDREPRLIPNRPPSGSSDAFHPWASSAPQDCGTSSGTLILILYYCPDIQLTLLSVFVNVTLPATPELIASPIPGTPGVVGDCARESAVYQFECVTGASYSWCWSWCHGATLVIELFGESPSSNPASSIASS